MVFELLDGFEKWAPGHVPREARVADSVNDPSRARICHSTSSTRVQHTNPGASVWRLYGSSCLAPCTQRELRHPEQQRWRRRCRPGGQSRSQRQRRGSSCTVRRTTAPVSSAASSLAALRTRWCAERLAAVRGPGAGCWGGSRSDTRDASGSV